MGRLLRGAGAGILATGLMSIVMVAAKALGLMQVLPPKQITAEAATSAGADPSRMGLASFNASWLAAHVGYGAALGALYAVSIRFVPLPGPVRGLVYGLLVWTVNYLGALPALGLYPWPQDDSSGRTATMIAAHAVYGIALDQSLPRKA